VVTIQDADAVQTLTIASTATAAEGGAPGNFRITRTGDTSSPLDVTVTLVTGANGSTATPGTDFVPIPTTITIPAGASFVDVPVTAIDDGVPESAIETVVLELQPLTNFVIGANRATVGIADRTVATITVVAANPTIVEGTLPDGTPEFVFTRTAIPGATTQATQFPARTVNFILSGTAQNGIDFLPLSGQISFVEGSTVATIDLSVIADALAEPNETVIINLEPESVALAGYVIVGTQAIVTISDVPINGGGGQPGGGISGNDILGTANNDNIGTISTNGVIGRPLGSTADRTAEFNFTTPFNDSVVGGAGSDTVNGGAGDDTIDGGEGDDSLVGGDGNDSLVGGTNSPLGDTLVGGLGNDVFVVDDVADVIIELPNQGTDTVQASIDFTLPNNVETLILLTGATIGNGNTQDNLIVGNTADNLLSGDDGDDTILGGAGNDTINGGTGNDSLSGGPGADTFTYRFLFDGLDRITDFSGTGGDRILFETSGGTFLPQNFATTGAESPTGNFTNVVDVIAAGAAGTNIFAADLIRIFSTTIPDATALDAFLAAQLGAGATDSVIVYFDGTNVRLAYDRNPASDGGGSVTNENGAVDLAVFENLTNIASVSTFLLGAQGNVVLGEAPAGFVPNQSPDSLVGDDNSNLLQGFGGNDTLVGLGGNAVSYTHLRAHET
jgi:Ca2+-binding RTX toxin-like protein